MFHEVLMTPFSAPLGTTGARHPQGAGAASVPSPRQALRRYLVTIAMA